MPSILPDDADSICQQQSIVSADNRLDAPVLKNGASFGQTFAEGHCITVLAQALGQQHTPCSLNFLISYLHGGAALGLLLVQAADAVGRGISQLTNVK